MLLCPFVFILFILIFNFLFNFLCVLWEAVMPYLFISPKLSNMYGMLLEGQYNWRINEWLKVQFGRVRYQEGNNVWAICLGLVLPWHSRKVALYSVKTSVDFVLFKLYLIFQTDMSKHRCSPACTAHTSTMQGWTAHLLGAPPVFY